MLCKLNRMKVLDTVSDIAGNQDRRERDGWPMGVPQFAAASPGILKRQVSRHGRTLGRKLGSPEWAPRRVGGEDSFRGLPGGGNKPTAVRPSGDACIAIFGDISTT
jgi:hypothetical protein